MKKFKAESQKLLDLMINSIYTHKEIFLRELISNASDALDKLYFKSLQENLSGMSREDFVITIHPDKEAGTLTITDNGCGMTDEDLENNLGVIAHSGSLDFKKTTEKTEDVNIIGQFGVGFYSAFMVAKKVTVLTRAYNSDKAFLWESNGVEGYSISPAEKSDRGTVITLYLKEDSDGECYDEYLDTYRLKTLVKRYSDYIRYPIKMDVEKSRKKDGSDEFETYTEVETVNSMTPIWKKSKAEVTDEEYATYYKDKFRDYTAPLLTIKSSVEGAVTFNALLFVPENAPFNFYSKDYEKGLELYTNGVMIMEKCADLIPDCFGFIKGVVDSEDLSLNISRELLQHNRQLKAIASNLEKKIKNELASLLAKDREKYEKLWKAFGLSLKFGAYANYGEKKELLTDLLLFHSAKHDKLVTLAEYAAEMGADQKYIYYACGASTKAVMALPQLEKVLDAGYDVLCLTDDMDEFVIKIIEKYKEKEFKSAHAGDLGLPENAEEKKDEEKNKDLLAAIKEALGDKVASVKVSDRLKSHPVCLSTEGEISIEMEKVLNTMPNLQDKVHAQKVLEINANHPIFGTLEKLFASDKEKLGTLAKALLVQAELVEGLAVDNLADYSDSLCRLIAEL